MKLMKNTLIACLMLIPALHATAGAGASHKPPLISAIENADVEAFSALGARGIEFRDAQEALIFARSEIERLRTVRPADFERKVMRIGLIKLQLEQSLSFLLSHAPASSAASTGSSRTTGGTSSSAANFIYSTDSAREPSWTWRPRTSPDTSAVRLGMALGGALAHFSAVQRGSNTSDSDRTVRTGMALGGAVAAALAAHLATQRESRSAGASSGTGSSSTVTPAPEPLDANAFRIPNGFLKKSASRKELEEYGVLFAHPLALEEINKLASDFQKLKLGDHLRRAWDALKKEEKAVLKTDQKALEALLKKVINTFYCECTICLDEFGITDTHPNIACGHGNAFHEKCLAECKTRKDACPICRAKIIELPAKK